MFYKLLTTNADLQHFAALGNPMYNVAIPFEYFRQGKILGFYQDDKMVGGAAIITEGPLRSIEFMPAANRKADLPDLQDMLELNAIWLMKDVTNFKDVFYFWRSIMAESRKAGKKWALIPYNESISGLGRMYAATGMKVLYRGQPQGASHKRAVIGICSIPALYKCFITGAVIRLFRASVLKKPVRGTRNETKKAA